MWTVCTEPRAQYTEKKAHYSFSCSTCNLLVAHHPIFLNFHAGSWRLVFFVANCRAFFAPSWEKERNHIHMKNAEYQVGKLYAALHMHAIIIQKFLVTSHRVTMKYEIITRWFPSRRPWSRIFFSFRLYGKGVEDKHTKWRWFWVSFSGLFGFQAVNAGDRWNGIYLLHNVGFIYLF